MKIYDKEKNELILVNKKDIEDLIYYCDLCAGFLRQGGYDGKAESLEERYLKIGDAIGLKRKNNNDSHI